MLIYEPALDPYHSAVRILAIKEAALERSVEITIDGARIAEYFLVYPAALREFRFPADFRTVRKLIRDSDNPYRAATGKAMFERMRPIFFAALSSLGASNLIEPTLLNKGVVVSSNALPSELLVAVDRFAKRQSEIGKFVLSELVFMPINGEDGLKHRSGLIEHRYDVT